MLLRFSIQKLDWVKQRLGPNRLFPRCWNFFNFLILQLFWVREEIKFGTNFIMVKEWLSENRFYLLPTFIFIV